MTFQLYSAKNLKIIEPVWNKNYDIHNASLSTSSLLRSCMLYAKHLHGSNSMTKQPLNLTIEFNNRRMSIYKLIHQMTHAMFAHSIQQIWDTSDFTFGVFPICTRIYKVFKEPIYTLYFIHYPKVTTQLP